MSEMRLLINDCRHFKRLALHMVDDQTKWPGKLVSFIPLRFWLQLPYFTIKALTILVKSHFIL